MNQSQQKNEQDNRERDITLEVTAAVEEARAFVVTNDDEYQRSGDVLKALKARKDAVEAFFEPMVEAAHKAHKALTDRRKSYLDPIAAADKTVRNAVLNYRQKKDAERRAAEAEQRRLQQIESDRLLAEAAKHEEENRPAEAAATLAMAEVVSDMKPTPVVAPPPKMDGVSTSKVWVAEIIDEAKIPVTVAGVMLRPVDTAMLNMLAKNTKGTMEIPGVKFTQKETMRVR
jgi:hypothetical protein